MKRYLLTLVLSGLTLWGFGQENRSIDGAGNNLDHGEWGMAGTSLKRVTTNGYGNGMSSPSGQNRPSAREISNVLGDQQQSIPNALGLSDYIWAWGQFIDHDITLVHTESGEHHNIAIPECDQHFDPMCTGTQEMPLERSSYDPTTGTSLANPRQQINVISSYIDASVVYGISPEHNTWMRSFVDGKLKMAPDGFLPYNTVTGNPAFPIDPNAPDMVIATPGVTKYFVSGDVRANEHPALTSLHTLFVREHNRLCDQLKAQNPIWDDAHLYERARKMVGAYIQAVTFEEFLPAMGVTLSPYLGYDSEEQASVMQAFSVAAYRFGHSTVSSDIVLLDANGSSDGMPDLDLAQSFFNPTILPDLGIEPVFRGLATQAHQELDLKVIPELRNFLFGPPGSGGLDLLSLNLQRGREHGLADYNTIRVNVGLPALTDFSEITSNTTIQQQLESLYGDINDIDPWVGMMAEDHLSGKLFGETMHKILKMQFEALRNGDRYYYENDPALTEQQIQAIKNTKLADIIRRNTSIEFIQNDIFKAYPFDAVSTTQPEQDVFNLSVAPNPIGASFSVLLELERSSKTHIQITDIHGRVMQEMNLELTAGKQGVEIKDAASWANGLYLLTLTTEQGTSSIKIVK